MLPVTWAEAVAASLPPLLASGRACAAVRRTLRTVGPAASSCTYVECRLARGDSRADVIVGVGPSHRAHLRAGGSFQRACAGFRPHPAWQAALLLADRWAAGALEGVRSFWLEFDLEAGRPHPPTPSVFLGSDAPGGWSPDAWKGLLAPMLASVLRRRPPPLARVLLRACAEEGGRVPYLGIMLGRDAAAVRLCLLGLAAPSLARLLAAAGWTGDRVHFRRVTSEVEGALAGHLHDGPGLVHLDVGARVLPAVGIEYVLARRPQVRGRLDETSLLDYLAASGVADAGKLRALAQWPGHARAYFDHELWPSVVVRRVNNVKLVFLPGPRLVAKAYLCATSGLPGHGRRAATRGAN